jgi:hypothetical protein
MDRRDTLRAGIAKTEKIIEVGPSYNPLTPKREGWRSYVIDHADTESLIEKYRNVALVDADNIEPVDFVWTKGAISDAVPQEHHGTFDVFVASHVFEHVPDLVSVLRSAEVLCRPDARMVLALPDKRVCFDFFRPLSTTGDVLSAHWEKRSRHTAKTLWDHFAYTATKNGIPGWGRDDQTPLTLIHSMADTVNLSQKSNSDEYIDAHAWTFVPSSFSLIMLELAYLGLTDWSVERTQTAEGTEFYIWLRRGALAKVAALSPSDLATERTRLLTQNMLELNDQGRQLSTQRRATDERKNAELELVATRRTIEAIRSSRAWRARSALRKVLGFSTTAADD